MGDFYDGKLETSKARFFSYRGSNILRLWFENSFHICHSIHFRFLVFIVTSSHPVTVTLFFSQHNGVVSSSPLLFFFCGFPHCLWVWPLIRTAVYIRTTFLIDHIVAIYPHVSTIHFLFNQSYFNYYLLLWFYFDLIGHFEFQLLIMFYSNILR